MNDQWTNRLSEYVDGELTPAERTALDAHLVSCAACRATLGELKRVVARAQQLDDRPPTADLWPGIAARIGVSGANVVSLSERRARRVVFSIPEAVAAGLALMLVSAGAAWLALRSPATPASATSAQVSAVAARGPGAPAAWTNADSRFGTAVAELEQALAAGAGRLDSTTIRVLEQNLAVIDRAIAQARAALAADPANAYLNHHLADTMRRKLELLRRANALAAARS